MVVDGSKKRSCWLRSFIDNYIFIKGGYSIWRHLIPFAIASLLLIILSVPKDNLILKLVKLLQRPGWIWVPTVLLTITASMVYILTMKLQIRQAYFFPEGDLRRTIGTTLTYILLCALMAYLVLQSTSTNGNIFGEIWTCLLVAVLSLTGIGWSGPNSWVDSIGIKLPDYTAARISYAQAADTLQTIRKKTTCNSKDVDDFLKAINDLYTGIEANFHLEPAWSKRGLEGIRDALRSIKDQIEELKKTKKDYFFRDFACVCRYQKEDQYGKFISTLRELGGYFHDWQYIENQA